MIKFVFPFFFFKNVAHYFLSAIATKRPDRVPFPAVPSTSRVYCRLGGFSKGVSYTFNSSKVCSFLDFLFHVSRRKVSYTLADDLFHLLIYQANFSDGPGQHLFVRMKEVCVSPASKPFLLKCTRAHFPVCLGCGKGEFMWHGIFHRDYAISLNR